MLPRSSGVAHAAAPVQVAREIVCALASTSISSNEGAGKTAVRAPLRKTSSAVGPNRGQEALALQTTLDFSRSGACLVPPSAQVEGAGQLTLSSQSARRRQWAQSLSISYLSMPSSSCLFRCRCCMQLVRFGEWLFCHSLQVSAGRREPLLKGAGRFLSAIAPHLLPRGEICQFPTEAVCRVLC